MNHRESLGESQEPPKESFARLESSEKKQGGSQEQLKQSFAKLARRG